MIAQTNINTRTRYLPIIPLLLLISSALVSIWAAYDPMLSLPTLLTLLGSVGLFFAVACDLLPPSVVVKGLVMLGGLVAFYFVGQYAYFEYWTETGSLAELGRLTGSILPNFAFFSPYPNAIAAFLEGAFLFNWLLIRRSHGLERIAWSGLGGLIIYGLLISASRGAWIGLGIALFLWLFFLLPKPAWRFALLGMVIAGSILGGCVLFYIISSGHSIPLMTSLLETLHSRFVLYRNVFYLMGDYPFTGIGLGDTFALVYSQYQLLIPYHYLFHTHNLFLAVGLGQGIMGLTAMIWLVISFYWFVSQVERTGGADHPHLFFRAAWLSVTASLIHGFIDAAQFSKDYWTMPLLFILPGLTISMGRPALAYICQKKGVLEEKGLKHYWPWQPAFMGLGLILAVLLYRQPLLSAWYANLGAIYQTRADLAPGLDKAERPVIQARAIVYFEQSLQLNPDQTVANRRLGMIALEYQHFDLAVSYLERAYQHEPGNQAILKALGYAYLWTGRLNLARELLCQLDDRGELVEELGNWRSWWQSQAQFELSDYANQMIQLLSEAS